MTDFLLELRSEEIPARMQDKARADLSRLFDAELANTGLVADEIVTYATPRRLALIARGLPTTTAAIQEETKGPRAAAPPQALEGFLRKTGLLREQLVERDGVLFAVIERPGIATSGVLANAIKTIVHKFPWPKSMRWGAVSTEMSVLRWVRPLHGVVALFGDEIVEGEVELSPGRGIPEKLRFGAATVGHRFHHPGVITIGSAADYVEKLRACHVIVDQDERQSIIALGATMAAAKAGLTLVRDEGLLVENAGLTEWPVPLLGRFDAAFLDVPSEVIQLTARVNQKYFVCQDAEGKLANTFVCTANIDAADGGEKIVDGNRKVLAARLSDAKFFYDTDLKVPLDEQAKKLGSIVFHEKLGTVADKVDRVAKLARWLAEEGIIRAPAKAGAQGDEALPNPGLLPSQEHLAAQAERAARLAKADLVTGMVGEFPELQGLMGGYYALAQGEDPVVAEAIRDHYKPVGQGDAVPTAPVTVAVSLADKLDTISQFFFEGLTPTGSKDPFALRRAALGVIQLINDNALRLHLLHAGRFAMMLRVVEDRAVQDVATDLRHRLMFGELSRGDDGIASAFSGINDAERTAFKQRFEERYTAVWAVAQNLLDFFADRLKVQQREAGVRPDLIDAVFATKDKVGGGEDDLVRLLARVHALQAFVGTPDGANLLAGYKRAANILKKEGWDADTFSRHPGLEPGSRFTDAAEGNGAPDQVRDDDAAAGEKELSYTPEKAEAALISALDSAGPRAAAAVGREDFEGAMAALASLRAPIDAFFDTVTVNDPDPDKRAARFGLLARMRDAVHAVADFSRIDGG